MIPQHPSSEDRYNCRVTTEDYYSKVVELSTYADTDGLFLEPGMITIVRQ